MEKTKVTHSAFRRFTGAVVGLASALLMATSAYAQDPIGVYSVTAVDIESGHTYSAGEKIQFRVTLEEDAENVSGGTPYLRLGIQNQNNTDIRASYESIDAATLIFGYTVQPGDFSEKVTVLAFNTSGARIQTAGGDLTDTVIPNARNLAGVTIPVRTIKFNDGSAVMSATGYKGSSLSVPITRGSSASAAQSFEVTASAANKVTLPVGFTIPAGDSNAICELPLLATTDGAMTVTFHPVGYTGTAGDLVLNLTIVEANKPYIVSVRDDGDGRTEPYTVGQTIDIAVQFNGDITDVIGEPYIKLDIENQDTSDKRAEYTGEFDGDTMFFQYTVQPGDFSDDLDCVNFGFTMNGASIYVNGVAIARSGYRAMPVGGIENSLSYNSDIKIRTISFDDYTLSRTETGKEGDTVSLEITRRAEASIKQTFNVTASQDGKVTWSSNFSIPAGAISAYLDVLLLERTTSPMTITIHPAGYTSTAGDMVLNLTINEGEKPAVYITGSSQLTEGGASTQLSVSLARPPKSATTIVLTSDNASKIQFLSSTTLIWSAGDENAKLVTIQPLDGGANVNITAHDNSGNYGDGLFSIYVENVSPTLIAPAMTGADKDEPWEDTASEGFAYTLTWSGTDVQADRDTLYATISWGDGATGRYDGATGFAQHLYSAAGTFNVTVTLHDKDGGMDSSVGKVTVESAVTIVINEYKHLLDGQSWQGNPYKGLPGLGRGSVDDNLSATTRTLVYGDYNWSIKYSPTQRDVTFTAIPESFEVSEQNADGTMETKYYDSFFHVWINKDEEKVSLDALTPVAPNTTVFRLITDSDGDAKGVGSTIGAVFAREHYPEDGCADIDLDGLPDKWEELYFGKKIGGGSDDEEDVSSASYTFETVTGDYGANGNPDNDFLPAGCIKNEHVVYPLGSYAPNGLAYNNLYEARGFHHGLNMKPNPYSQESLPIDEPHMGKIDDDDNLVDTDIRDFYGTDPTDADSDGDGLLDGFEYYWWRVAKEAAEGTLEGYTANSFRKYNPASPVTDGEEIALEEIELVFHPLVPTSTKNGRQDIDGDGLSNFEEMLLGTNPLHWDTDGDTMNDGWEVMWGLNPLDPNDADLNPDGDFMAAYGEDSNNIVYRHAEVYQAFGFDPRTAWTWQYKDRNHKLASSDAYSYAPNTMPYSNKEEYYLGQWCVEMGITDSVDPMSRTYFTQPVPAGQLSYISITGAGHSLNKTTYGGDETNEVDRTNTIQIPPSTLVYMTEITTHGCDSDGDGMPDGWELYVCCGDNDFALYQLWPTSDDGSSALDAQAMSDDDSLPALRECHSTDLCDYYSGIYSNFTANANGNWYNKWWPCDPWNADTDFDGLTDSQEGDSTFRYAETRTLAELEERYGANTMTRGHVPGGGLNPNAVDTDMDYLPDAFEYQYAGYNRATDWEGGFVDQDGLYSRWVNPTTIELAGGGMDGTYFDSRNCYDEFEGKVAADSTNKVHFVNEGGVAMRDFDFDHDGLSNYQEYWINGMFHFQYDKWTKGLDYGDYDVQQIFNTGVFSSVKQIGVYWTQNPDGSYSANDMELGSKTYDWSRYAENWQEEGSSGPNVDPLTGDPIYPFFYMPPEVRPYPMGSLCYAAADPRIADSDGDNMDDYYEMFHGLNPILSENADICNQPLFRPADVYDFNKCPWLAGMPNADPDQDGLPNWEEALSPNEPAPANYNTDPSPLWFTDISYSHSFVNLYYNFGSAMNYWCPESSQVYELYPDPAIMSGDARPNYLFSFEMNEGFDTDNDNLSDRYELFGTAGGVTDPLDPDRPVGRKALYLDGNAAARTRGVCAFGKNALRSWTIEAWVRPEEPASGKRQIILERPCTWNDGDSTPSYDPLRRTFRLGLEANGAPFVEFNNGAKDFITEQAVASQAYALEANTWHHLAATFDGFKMQLKLYIDGRCVSTKATSSIPYTGFTYSGTGTLNGDYSNPRWSPIVIGASDSNPDGHVDGGFFYSNGAIYDLNSQPVLGDFFKGWIDEVRIWTGARPGGDDSGDVRVSKWGWPTIKDDVDSFKRYGSREVLAARNNTVRDFERIIAIRKLAVEASKGNSTSNEVWSLNAEGMTFDEFYEEASAYLAMTGGETVELRVPPNLLCCYNFDNLPDPNYETAVPAKFESLNGRPVDYAGAPWWRQAYDRTTVYKGASDAPYCFPHYAENLVATMPLGALKRVGTDNSFSDIVSGQDGLDRYEYEGTRVVDSVFWTKYTKAGIPLAECAEYGETGADYVNKFPNTTNPYGEYYITSNYSGTESHPSLMLQESFDPVYAVMYNHVLPLRNAYADMSVQLWDDPNGTGVGVNVDSDGDGLPDYYELSHGMDPYNADENGNGILDAHDDFDGDGLSNLAEWKAGTDPWNSDTDGDGIADYYDQADGSARMNGVVFTDNDYVDDMWESQWDDVYASSGVYDEHLDRDLDGWDNWSEQLFTYNFFDVNADAVVTKTGTSVDKAMLNLVSADEGTWYGRNWTAKNGFVAMEWYVIEERDASDWDETKFVVTSDIQYALTRPLYTPTPDIKLTLNYNNGISDPKFGYWVSQDNDLAPDSFQFNSPSEVEVVVHVYSDRAMNGTPDAVFMRKITNNGIWPLEITLCRQDLVYGHVRQGRNWFFVFVNFDGSTIGDLSGGQTPWPTWSQMVAGGDYTAIEPCGINDDFVEGVEIGWGDNEVRVALSDDAPSFARFSWTEITGASPRYDDHVIEICNGVGDLVFSKVLVKPRTWIHEGDIIDYQAKRNGDKNFGLDSGNIWTTSGQTHSFDDASINSYTWFLDGVEMGAITNFYSSTVAAPALLAPVNAAVYAARPEFQFRLAPEMTEFQFELRRGSANGTVIYSGRHLAPGRYRYDQSNFDLVIWQFPYSAGDVMPNGQVFAPGYEAYYWKVTGYSPALASGKASATGNFRLAASAEPGNNGDKGVIRVNVNYPGMAAFSNGQQPKVRVQAYSTPSFNGRPDAEVTLTDLTQTAVLLGLDVGDYYIRAFVDQDGNYIRSNWESWGYLRKENAGSNRFRPVTTHASQFASEAPVTVTIGDADTDNDSIPDALEYIMYKTAKGNVPADDKTWFFSQSWLSLTGPGPVISSPGYTDFDGDGLNDLAELNFGSDPFSADSDGDGISDKLERMLGFSATSPEFLKITNAAVADGVVSLAWAWDLGEASGSSAGTSGRASGRAPASVETLATTVTYVIEATESLSDPNWVEIARETTNAKSASVDFTGLDNGAPARFFRVRVIGLED